MCFLFQLAVFFICSPSPREEKNMSETFIHFFFFFPLNENKKKNLFFTSNFPFICILYFVPAIEEDKQALIANTV